MVKPSSRAGQRRRAISWRTIRGRFGSSSVVSAARAATPAVAARRINLRLVILVVERKGNRFRALTLLNCAARGLHFQHVLSACLFQHNPSLPVRDMTGAVLPKCVSRSEGEHRLQFNAAVGRSTLRERTSLQSIGLVKQLGAQNRIRIGHVHFVENIASTQPKSEVITAVGIGRGVASTTAAEQRTTRAAAAPTAAARRSTLSLNGAGSRLYFESNSESLGEAQVQREVGRASLRVDRERLSGGARRVESSQLGAVDRPLRQRACWASGR